MKIRLINDWRPELNRLWSMQVSLFLLALQGGLAVLMAFVGVLNPWLILGISIAGTIILGVARMLKQEGCHGDGC